MGISKIRKAKLQSYNICVVGLGYVGLPLFKIFSKSFHTFGLEKNESRINIIHSESESVDLVTNKITSRWEDVAQCNIFIVAVQTPIDDNKNPDTSALTEVCESIAKILKKGDVIIFESTVFPGATNEICIPILEKKSHFVLNKDFYVGFSPERINIGDIEHQIINTPKIVSASNDEALDFIFHLYKVVLEAPVIKASSIKTAEATKMYENVQRDVLIALANEFASYCAAEGLDINEITRNASTKWNFSEVYPGLVGGHCIAVDPYYLIARSKSKHVKLPLIQLSRHINELKVDDVASRIIRYISKQSALSFDKSNLLILGFSYKPNCNDIRNTKVARIIELLRMKFCRVDCYDPYVSPKEVKDVYGIKVFNKVPNIANYNFLIKLVNHQAFEGILLNTSKLINIDSLM